MSLTVFFSWQSDTPNREGRNFIQRALEAAVANIADDVSVEEPVREGLTVDKDTKDVPGSPPILQTILNKIDQASVFVADLTFCATRLDGGPSPNPNVLIEYGWALKSLGHYQLLAVMNDVHGTPSRDSLPFDLAQFRFPITYSLSPDASDPTRKAEREKLAKQLEAALRGVLESGEFKAKLPKEPVPPPFPRKTPKSGRARFRQLQEQLGFARDSLGQRIGMPSARRVFLLDGPAMWLRLMPTKGPDRNWLTQNVKQSALNLAMLPLMDIKESIGFLEAEDGCGYYATYKDSQTYSVAYVFNTGEIWIINSIFGQTKDYFELREDAFIKTLEGAARFLESQNCAKPYEWVVGLEGVSERNLLLTTPPYRPLGVCVTDLIEREGVYKDGDTAAEMLRPFFEAVFDYCGVKRL